MADLTHHVLPHVPHQCHTHVRAYSLPHFIVTKHACSHIHTSYIDYFITAYYLFGISEALNSIYETSLLTKHPLCVFIHHNYYKLTYYF